MTEELDPDLLARAEAGDAEAQNAVGKFYMVEGADAEQCDVAEGWFWSAAEQGHPEALYNLGRLHAGIRRAFWGYDWFMRAAKAGHMPAIVRLAATIDQWDPSSGDLPLFDAEHWLNAAQTGDAGAQLIVGKCHAVGLGRPVDKVEAARFFGLSAAQGLAEAGDSLSTLWRDLSAEQRALAEPRLRELGLMLPAVN